MKTDICLVASDGGHLNQLLLVKNGLSTEWDYVIVTEKSDVSKSLRKSCFLKTVNRKEVFFAPKMLYNLVLSFNYYWRFRPKIIISTGALSTVPICILGKLFKSKLIFIESFSKTNTPTATGKLMYHLADAFFVQRQTMLKAYPKAIYKGSLL